MLVNEDVYNLVVLAGYLKRKKFIELENDNYMYKGELFFEDTLSGKVMRIGAWGKTAQALNDVPTGSNIKIVGHIDTSEFEGSCFRCGGKQKVKWFEIVVNYFTIIN